MFKNVQFRLLFRQMAEKGDELAQLEAEFQEVITELTDDPNLDRFRLEYEKIHSALKKSNASNQRLQQKCRELNAEIVANASKVAHALKLSQDDQAWGVDIFRNIFFSLNDVINDLMNDVIKPKNNSIS